MPARPIAPESSSRTTAVSPFKGPTPFEADRNRKNEPKAEATPTESPVSGTGFIANNSVSTEVATSVATAVAVAEEQPEAAATDPSLEQLRDSILGALEDAGQQVLAHNLETGEWSAKGNEVSVKVSMSQVMVDFALARQQSGDGIRAEQAIYEAAIVRFRPIMMTTMAALMGTLPIALGTGMGAESRRPLGLCVAGGLLFSQLLTLYITPVLYTYLENLQERFGSFRPLPESDEPKSLAS